MAAIDIDPNFVSSYFGRGMAYNERGQARNDLGDQARALADYAKAIEPNQAWAYFKTGKAAEELPDAAKSLELSPNNARARYKGEHLRSSGQVRRGDRGLPTRTLSWCEGCCSTGIRHGSAAVIGCGAIGH
jgi:tetratricopeptide (TPR) repeat protein